MESKRTTIDLRNEKLVFISFHSDNGESVHQIIFEDTTIILNDEQIERLRT